MRGHKFYHLAAIKSYFLAHEYHNDVLKKYVKNTYFNNLFSIYDQLIAFDDNNKVLITEEDYKRISIPLIPLIKNYMPDAKVYPKTLSKDAFQIIDTNNESIIENYTRNYTKNNCLKGKNNIIKKAKIYKKHITNLKHIHSFNQILSLDFEYNELNKDGVSEIGICIYRPKEKTFIYEHLLIKGRAYNSGKKLLLQNSFNFGKTEVTDKNEAFHYLLNLIENSDILLAHDIINELQILSMKPQWTKVIDTKICELIINPQDRYLSLKDSLKKRKMTASYLHNAGNDAAYALHLALYMHNEIFKVNFKI